MLKVFNLVSIEIFLICISIISWIIIYVSRYGFLQDIQLIFFSILISLYLICFPNFFKSHLKLLQTNKWYSSLSFLNWVGLFTIFLGGIINERLEINLHYFFSILGVIFLMYMKSPDHGKWVSFRGGRRRDTNFWQQRSLSRNRSLGCSVLMKN